MVKQRLSFGIMLLILSALAINCGSSVVEEAAIDREIENTEGQGISSTVVDDDEHMADDEDEHMADDEDEHMADDENGHTAVHAEVPQEYEDLNNPLVGDETAIAAGGEAFATYCVACHGTEGRGDGPAATALNPAPANFADGAMMDMTTDPYLYWRISEGGLGDPFNSAMPPWKATFSDGEMWQLVSYLRTLSE